MFSRFLLSATGCGEKIPIIKFALSVNTPAQIEPLMHSPKQAAREIGLYVNWDKTEFMCFNQDGAIFSLNGKPLKVADHFTYFGRYNSNSESEVNIRTD